MLDLLQLEPGQKVFELGTGSGWNAALIGRLVGGQGLVHSLEIIPEMARTAAATLQALGIRNVRVIQADAGEGYAAGAPYDRAIFTAGAYDLPHHFFDQLKEGGLLLAVIKSAGGGDSLFLLRKVRGHFESLESMPCFFVQMTGKHQLEGPAPVLLDALPGWAELKNRPAGTRSFWWGGKGKEGSGWLTLGIRSFLSITEPRFLTFKSERSGEHSREEYFFGLWDEEQGSLVIARDDLLLSYGGPSATQRLMMDLEGWLRLGMPGAASFALQVYPSGVPLKAEENQWIVKRPESQFLWSLPA